MGTCKGCKWWEASPSALDGEPLADGHGLCSAWDDDVLVRVMDATGTYYTSPVFVATKPDFGCNRFTPREGEEAKAWEAEFVPMPPERAYTAQIVDIREAEG